MGRCSLLAATACVVLAAAGCSGDTAGRSAATTSRPETTSTTDAPATTAVTVTTLASTTTDTAAPTSTTTFAPPTRPLPFDSWTAVLASLPVGENTADQAQTVAEKLGVSGAGVLLSDDYPSLEPGFWVVYAAPYAFSWEAAAACERLVEVAPDCYARYLGADPEEPVGRESGTLIAVTEADELVILSTSTGEILRTVDDSFGRAGSFPSSPALAADGRTITYSVGSEDFWFSCEASDGHLERRDLATGRAEKTGDGFSPTVSPDGATLIYLASSECFPDPAEPQFVLAPIDTIVWRDVDSERETRHTVPLLGNVADGYELWDVAAGPDAVFVVDTEGTVWRYPPPGDDPVAGTPLVDLPTAGLDVGDHGLVGFDAARSRLLVTYTYFDTDAQFTELHAIDPTTGDVARLGSYEGTAAFALDITGRHLVEAGAGRLVVDGTEIPTEAGLTSLAW